MTTLHQRFCLLLLLMLQLLPGREHGRQAPSPEGACQKSRALVLRARHGTFAQEVRTLCTRLLKHAHTWGQRLPQLLGLVAVCHAERVQVPLAADLELGRRLGLLDLHRPGILSPGWREERDRRLRVSERWAQAIGSARRHSIQHTGHAASSTHPNYTLITRTSEEEVLNLSDLLGLQGGGQQKHRGWVSLHGKGPNVSLIDSFRQTAHHI